MEMTYNGTLVMPANYAVVNEEEMTYVEGGASASVYGTASNIKARLDAIISLALAGTGTGTAIGAVIGMGFGAAAGAVLGNALFGSWRSCASAAHSVVEGIISQYGSGQWCKMTTTTSFEVYCTGISVSIA